MVASRSAGLRVQSNAMVSALVMVFRAWLEQINRWVRRHGLRSALASSGRPPLSARRNVKPMLHRLCSQYFGGDCSLAHQLADVCFLWV